MTQTNTQVAIGIKTGHSITWYRAHSLTRRKDGSFCVFALDDQRTPITIKAKDFAGVCGPDCIRGVLPHITLAGNQVNGDA